MVCSGFGSTNPPKRISSIGFVCLFVYDSFNDSLTQNSSVIIVTTLWGSISVRDEIFVVSKLSVPALGPTHGTAQRVQGAVSPGVKVSWRDLTTCETSGKPQSKPRQSPI